MTLGILHTTESGPGTGAGVASYLRRNGIESHYVIDPSDGYTLQLVPGDTYAKSLTNLPGGVETNRRDGGVIQVEIVGRAADCGNYDPAWYDRLRDQLAEISLAHSIAWTFRPDPTRLTFAEWDDPSLQGWLGHCHVPENSHWDPGTLDYARLLNNDQIGTPMTPQEFASATGGTVNLIGQVCVPLVGDDLQSTDLYTVAQALSFIHQELKIARLSGDRDQANKILAAVQGLTPQAASIRSFTTAELLAELVRRSAA